MFTFIRPVKRIPYLGNGDQGFTLIELLVVIIIMGILMAITVPNVMGQIGKAREASAKKFLSSVATAQQAYFFERAQFASSLALLDLTSSINYYTVTEPTLIGTTVVKHEAHGESAELNNIRNYGLGVYFVNNSYQITLCQSSTPSQLTQAGNSPNDDCSNNGVKLR